MHGITTTIERNAMSSALDTLLVEQTQAIWEREVALEFAMCDDGADQFRAASQKAQDKRQLSHLRPFRKLTETLIAPVDKALSTWIAEWAEAGAGRRPVALKYLKDFPTDVASLIAVREVLDRIGGGTGRLGAGGEAAASSPNVNMKLMAVGNAIGMRIQTESRMLAWQKANPDLWGAVQHGLERQHATPIHRQRVNINRFNTKVREEIEWQDWPREHVFHVGLAMVEQLVVGTGGRVKIELDPTAERNKKQHSNPYVLVLNEEMTTTLFEAMDTEASRHPVYMPTIIKPIPWSDMKDGGYHTEVLRGRRQLVRFNASHEEQKSKAVRELSHVNMPAVYNAINTVQEVPWMINQRVYAIARHCWDNDLAIAGMPQQTRIDVKAVMPRPEAADTDEAVDAEWRVKATELHAFNAKLPSLKLKAKRSLDIAAKYLEDVFYFPHFLDFRGRMYPIPVDLQPQGQDLARGLLTFAMGKPVSADNSYWLAIHLANVWGMDKIPFGERFDWVITNEAMWLSIALDPLADRRWASSPGEDYWQALAAALEWARYLKEGPGMVSSLPVRVDGTCNGIQHLSAMVRDRDGGASVNLVPDDHPHDIYTEIGAIVQDMFTMLAEQGGENGALAQRWLEAVGGKFPRSLTKRPVMIFPYGGTREAYRKYTYDWMQELDSKTRCFPADRKLRSKMLNLMVTMLWAGVSAQLKKPREVQKWLQDCAKLACASGAPLRWETPAGFVVRHFYGVRKVRQIKTNIDGQVIKLVDWEVTADLDTAEHLKGIPPNFTHSMDASVLMTTVNMAWNAEVDSITCIHDAYGTVAADMDMLNACLRKSFVETYRQPVLENFRDHCLAVLDDDQVTRDAMPPVPTFGTLDIEQVLDSEYFFA